MLTCNGKTTKFQTSVLTTKKKKLLHYYYYLKERKNLLNTTPKTPNPLK